MLVQCCVWSFVLPHDLWQTNVKICWNHQCTTWCNLMSLVTEFPFCSSFLTLDWCLTLSHAEYGWLMLLAALLQLYVGHLHPKATIHIYTILYLEKCIIKKNQCKVVRTCYSSFTTWSTSAKRPINKIQNMLDPDFLTTTSRYAKSSHELQLYLILGPF